MSTEEAKGNNTMHATMAVSKESDDPDSCDDGKQRRLQLQACHHRMAIPVPTAVTLVRAASSKDLAQAALPSPYTHYLQSSPVEPHTHSSSGWNHPTRPRTQACTAAMRGCHLLPH
eukprot:15475798-Alexandrium_andersonii.AAC.3